MGRPIRLTQQQIAAVTRVKEYIDKHPLENKTTAALAEYAAISRNLLQKGFKEVYGTHVKEYYTTQKLEAAKGLLEGGIAIGQVARLCQYRSHSAFTTAFKNKFGMSPLAWLKQQG